MNCSGSNRFFQFKWIFSYTMSHFADFGQFKIMSHFADFGQVKYWVG